MNPARILICIDGLAAGGAERQTVELLKRLNRDRFLPQVVSLHGPRLNFSRHFVNELEIADIPVTELDRRWSRAELWSSLTGLYRVIRAFQPHLVHSVGHHANHLTRILRLWPGSSFRLLTAIRTAYDARQLRNERLSHRLSTFVVCNSPAMARRLQEEARIPSHRLRFIPNGLDLARFAHNPDPELRSRLAPHAVRLVVMLARITEQKAPHLLVQAVGELKKSNRLPDRVEFWIVGDRASETVQSLVDDAIRTYDLASIVRLFPATNQAAAFFHAADFSVLASLWEGTPNSVLESLAAGRPALVSTAANESGLIRPGLEGWLVSTNNVEALALGLSETLSLSSSQLAALAPACRARAAEFDLPKMVEHYEALYLRLLGRD